MGECCGEGSGSAEGGQGDADALRGSQLSIMKRGGGTYHEACTGGKVGTGAGSASERLGGARTYLFSMAPDTQAAIPDGAGSAAAATSCTGISLAMMHPKEGRKKRSMQKRASLCLRGRRIQTQVKARGPS